MGNSVRPFMNLTMARKAQLRVHMGRHLPPPGISLGSEGISGFEASVSTMQLKHA